MVTMVLPAAMWPRNSRRLILIDEPLKDQIELIEKMITNVREWYQDQDDSRSNQLHERSAYGLVTPVAHSSSVVSEGNQRAFPPDGRNLQRLGIVHSRQGTAPTDRTG